MNTKLLMTISAFALGGIGVVLIFMPDQLAWFLDLDGSMPIVLQVSGGLYFGFAMLNWTAKANLMGGIYSRPVAIANFTHFLIGGLSLIKWVLRNGGSIYIWAIAILYLIFAALFCYVLFNSPGPASKAV